MFQFVSCKAVRLIESGTMRDSFLNRKEETKGRVFSIFIGPMVPGNLTLINHVIDRSFREN